MAQSAGRAEQPPQDEAADALVANAQHACGLLHAVGKPGRGPVQRRLCCRVHKMFRRASASRMTFSPLQDASRGQPSKTNRRILISTAKQFDGCQTRHDRRLRGKSAACLLESSWKLENRSPPGTEASRSGKNPSSAASGGAVVAGRGASCPSSTVGDAGRNRTRALAMWGEGRGEALSRLIASGRITGAKRAGTVRVRSAGRCHLDLSPAPIEGGTAVRFGPLPAGGQLAEDQGPSPSSPA